MINKIKKALLNYRKRFSNEINYIEMKELIKQNENAVLIDVRSKQEYNEYHLPNAINIPVYEIENRIVNYVKDKNELIILYCQMGSRSKNAKRILEKLQYNNVYNLKGGLDFI